MYHGQLPSHATVVIPPWGAPSGQCVVVAVPGDWQALPQGQQAQQSNLSPCLGMAQLYHGHAAAAAPVPAQDSLSPYAMAGPLLAAGARRTQGVFVHGSDGGLSLASPAPPEGKIFVHDSDGVLRHVAQCSRAENTGRVEVSVLRQRKSSAPVFSATPCRAVAAPRVLQAKRDSAPDGGAIAFELRSRATMTVERPAASQANQAQIASSGGRGVSSGHQGIASPSVVAPRVFTKASPALWRAATSSAATLAQATTSSFHMASRLPATPPRQMPSVGVPPRETPPRVAPPRQATRDVPLGRSPRCQAPPEDACRVDAPRSEATSVTIQFVGSDRSLTPTIRASPVGSGSRSRRRTGAEVGSEGVQLRPLLLVREVEVVEVMQAGARLAERKQINACDLDSVAVAHAILQHIFRKVANEADAPEAVPPADASGDAGLCSAKAASLTPSTPAQAPAAVAAAAAAATAAVARSRRGSASRLEPRQERKASHVGAAASQARAASPPACGRARTCARASGRETAGGAGANTRGVAPRASTVASKRAPARGGSSVAGLCSPVALGATAWVLVLLATAFTVVLFPLGAAALTGGVFGEALWWRQWGSGRSYILRARGSSAFAWATAGQGAPAAEAGSGRRGEQTVGALLRRVEVDAARTLAEWTRQQQEGSADRRGKSGAQTSGGGTPRRERRRRPAASPPGAPQPREPSASGQGASSRRFAHGGAWGGVAQPSLSDFSSLGESALRTRWLDLLMAYEEALARHDSAAAPSWKGAVSEMGRLDEVEERQGRVGKQRGHQAASLEAAASKRRF